MLVLSRKIGESFVIGDDVVVTVRQMRGGRVRLSIEAPQDVLVLRQELIGDRPSSEEWDAPAEPRDVLDAPRGEEPPFRPECMGA